MSLKKRITDDAITALKSGDRLVSETLQSLKSVILNQEIFLGKRDVGLADIEVEKIVAQEVKKRKEASELYLKANRPELSDKELSESLVLEKYLPKQLNEVDIDRLIDQIVESEKIELVISNMGRIIGAVKKLAGNSAEGSLISKIVSNKINQN